jgi:ribosomal 30S subunit maturation factor RimM
LFFVKFDRIANREEAEALMDHGLFTDQKPAQTEQPEESSLVGYSVVSDKLKIGVVHDLLGSFMQQVLVVELLASEATRSAETLLIPLVDEYVKMIDHQTESIVCINLDQLEEE